MKVLAPPKTILYAPVHESDLLTKGGQKRNFFGEKKSNRAFFLQGSGHESTFPDIIPCPFRTPWASTATAAGSFATGLPCHMHLAQSRNLRHWDVLSPGGGSSYR